MYTTEKGLWIAYGGNGPISITGKMANRHGLIAGATGTGKTVTLQVMAETFSQAGVPCFMADMKGDLSGISQTGATSSFIEKRKAEFGIENPEFQSCPVRLYDVFGEQGHPMRARISDMGPDLLSRLMELNETQTGVLNIVFRVADDRGLEITDLKDLRSMLDYVAKNAKQYTTDYGNISSASVGAIQRALLQLDNQGASSFFGEPAFEISDLIAVDKTGKGILSVLEADRLMLQPKLYSTFLLWLLSELYATLPEVGDKALPKLIFFFDEAHTLFDGTSKALTSKIEQVIRLIRSKGVGIYFVTQNPTDIPEEILGQLGNRVQHALRAFTPKDQKAVKAAAETFRANPSFDTKEAIMSLGTGEALVSVLDEKGAPTMVERANILFPLSQIGAITDEQRKTLISGSDIAGKYDTAVDNVSAYEKLLAEAEGQKEPETQSEEKGGKGEKGGESEKESGGVMSWIGKIAAQVLPGIVGSVVAGMFGKGNSTARTAARSTATSITRAIVRSSLGTSSKKK